MKVSSTVNPRHRQ